GGICYTRQRVMEKGRQISMNLMELLQLVDARLRPLVGADESAVQAVLEEVAAGPRPEGVAPEGGPRVGLASRVVGLQQECRMLREHLQVELTCASRVDVKVSLSGPPFTRPAPTGPNEPD